MTGVRLPNNSGGTTDIDRALPGRAQVVWFFPRSNTPNCSVQARLLVEQWAALGADGVDVVGVSFDDIRNLAGWARQLQIPFPLCSADVTVAEALGAARPVGDPWRDALPARVALIVDDSGAIRAHWAVNDVHSFVDQVRSALNLR